MTIKRKFLSFLLLLLILSTPMAFAQSQQKYWQEVKSISGNFKAVSSQPEIEIFSAPNVVMIKVNRPTEVRLFTILGKLVSTQHLEPGIYEYHLESHGIYIVKTDESSCKIAI